jgi:hypothetical protein
MINLLKAKLCEWFPGTAAAEEYRYQQRIRTMVRDNRNTADAIERALMTSAYCDEKPYMCEALFKVRDLDYDVCFVARRMIMNAIAPNWFLMEKLEEEGTLDRAACKFEMRIVCSNWYWDFIRKLRKEADKLQTLIN